MDELRRQLQTIPYKKRLYFLYKFPEIKFKKDKQITTEELLQKTNVSTLDTFHAWERTEQFQQLKALYYEQRAVEDFYIMYEEISKKAKSGDEKAVKLFLTLMKELKSMNVKQVKVKEADGLVL